MAWYRAGGGGIPAALKTGMNDVLNKKFGTSTTYAPNTWPDNVNLLGKLPEKTVSGAIANITDGADRVPIKAWGVTLGASLEGVSSVDVVHTGKNLLNPTLYDGGAYNPTVDSQRTFTESATQFTHVGNTYSVSFTESWKTYTMLIPVKYGQAYYCNFTLSGTGTNLGTSVYFVDAENKVMASASNNTDNPQTRAFAVNVPSGAKYFCITFTNRGTTETTLTFTEPQIEVGSSASAFEPYTAPTTHTVSLGRTIYGGSVDVVSGTGTDYGLWVNLSDVAWTEDANRAGVFYGSVPGRKTASSASPSDVLGCTCYEVYNSGVSTSKDKYISGYWSYGGGSIFFRDSSFAGYTRAQVQEALQGEKVCVVSANATDFTFTPITPTPETALGVNNFWADEGDSSVTYRRDIDLALGGG